ncbi:helix-turn-helix domain-containing protein [Achromobacter aloeverae]
MNTHADVATVLRDAIKRRGLTQARLKEEAGLSQRTLTKVLSGAEDFKLSTLFALADRLGLALILAPLEAAPAVAAGPVTEPAIRSRVAGALERVDGSKHGADT